jgi:hypothetical protein
VHPTLGDRVFVLTTADGGYLWTSTDGGQTWKNPGAGWPANLTPGGVFVAAPPSQLVYVLIGQQLRRSADGGATFDAGIATPCSGTFEGSPADPRRLACYNHDQDFFYFSTDEGRNWSRGARAQANSANCRLINDFRNPLVYYSYCFAGEATGQRDLFFRSTDGMQTVFGGTPTPHDFPQFFVSPDRSLIISYGLGNTMSRSRDLGQTWEALGPRIGTSFGFDPLDANIVYRDGKSRSTDGGRTYTDTANRTYVPVLASIPPVEVTLESGTSYDPQVVLRDPVNHEFLLASFTPAIPATAPWIQYRDSYYYVVSSVGLSSGTYEASVGLLLGNFNVGQLAVKLHVVPRRDPPAFLKSTRSVGSGVYRDDSPPAAGPWPGDNGPATSAPLPVVWGMTSDVDGNLYAAFSYRVQRIAADGSIANFAGTGATGATGDGGQAAQATFQGISDVLKINEGVLILDGSARRMRLVRPNGTIEAFYTAPAGNPIGLDFRSKLATDSTGTVFVSTNNGVYRWQGGGTWTLVFPHSDIGTGLSNLLNYFSPFSSFTIDRRDNSFVLGYVDRIVRRSLSGQITLLMGTPGKTGFAGDGANTVTGSLTEAPRSLAVDSRGAVYFADHNRVRVILPTGDIGTVAGNGDFDHPPADNAAAASGGLSRISGVHVRPNDELAVYSSSLAYIFRMEATTAPVSATVVEYYHPVLDNYFITADPNEQAAVDAGAAGADWRRTGGTFKAGGPNQVCRFYGSQSPGPNSHFYTADAAECAELKRLQAITPASQKRWNFESNDFNTTPAVNGACPAGLVPVYRAYNNGFARGVDSNHRITASQAAIQEAANRGWVSEGVVMCAPV